MPTVLLESEAIRRREGAFRTTLAAAGFDLVVPPEPKSLTRDQLAGYLPQVDAVIMGVGTIDRPLIEQTPRLRVISRTGVGYDRIDLQAATDHKIAVTITPGANHDGVAEHTIGLIIALSKGFKGHDQALRAGTWDRSTLPRPVRGRTLGIVGMGRIGQAVAVRALGLGMIVLAHNPRPKPVPGVEAVPFESLLARSDVVSLHLPVKQETRGLFGATTLSRMRRGAILINTGRGELINEADLVHALQSGQIGGAGLDVFDPEPPRADHPLWAFPNVITTPHLSGLDETSVNQMAQQAATNLVELFQGNWPADAVVNSAVRAGWRW